jgi:uncharacterized cofD-like protein
VEGVRVVGQKNVAESVTPIARVRFAGGDAAAYAPAADAIRDADLVVIGPGSLFTSILPNFLVGGIREALLSTRGRVVYVCNVANQRGETTGMDAADHVDALVRHGLAGGIDVVLLHDEAAFPLPALFDPVPAGAAALARIRAGAAEVVLARMADLADPRHHDPQTLLVALQEVAG